MECFHDGLYIGSWNEVVTGSKNGCNFTTLTWSTCGIIKFVCAVITLNVLNVCVMRLINVWDILAAVGSTLYLFCSTFRWPKTLIQKKFYEKVYLHQSLSIAVRRPTPTYEYLHYHFNLAHFVSIFTHPKCYLDLLHESTLTFYESKVLITSVCILHNWKYAVCCPQKIR